MPADRQTRPVAANDPSLSPEANAVLTAELREAVGDRTVAVAQGTPRRSQGAHAEHRTATATLAGNRPVLIITFAAALVVGAVIAVATGAWWVLPLALVLHGTLTAVVAAGALQLTTQVEHLSPAAAARLEEEGVADPDRVFNDMVQEYAGDEPTGPSEVVRPGNNEQTAPGEDDPAKAASQQRSVITPSSGRTRPAGPGDDAGG